MPAARSLPLTVTRLYLSQLTVLLGSALLMEICGPVWATSTSIESAGSIGSGVGIFILGVGDGLYSSSPFFVMPLCTSQAVKNTEMMSAVQRVRVFIVKMFCLFRT